MPQTVTSSVVAVAPGLDDRLLPGGRLTLASADPLPVTDQLAKTTVYYTAFNHAFINLYDGATWVRVRIGSEEKSVAVPATTNTPFDVFGYLVSGDLVLETANWTDDTTRATALSRQDGFRVKSGSPTRLYLGTCRTTGVSGQCEDSLARRLVWNAYNAKERAITKTITATGYVYNTNAFRSVNADDTFRFDAVCGLAGHALIYLNMLILCTSAPATLVATAGIGVGSTTVNGARPTTIEIGLANASMLMQARVDGYLPLGYHFYQALERGGGGAGNYTWSNGTDRGLYGWLVG